MPQLLPGSEHTKLRYSSMLHAVAATINQNVLISSINILCNIN